jgi:predicted dehydrogenase
MGKIRWGVISTARIGENRVIPAIQASNNGVVTAVASRSLEKAQAFAARTGIPTAYGSYEALLADPDIDAIYNPLPNSEHAAWSIAAAEAGKPMLCEKPLAKDAAEAQTMIDAFAARGLLFAEAFMYRFHPQHATARRIIAEGGIGAIQIMSASFTFAVRSASDIRLQAELAGGALMDVGCYCVNAMRLIIGEEPVNVAAVARFGASGVDEAIAGALMFPSGAVGHFDAGVRAHRLHTYEVRGTEGRIQLDAAFVPHGLTTIVRHWHGDDYVEHSHPPVDQYRLMVEDFADALLNQRPPAYPPSDAVANMRVLDQLIGSARANGS